MDDRLYLRIKLKSLAAEARIIRGEERRQLRFARHKLNDEFPSIFCSPEHGAELDARRKYHRQRAVSLREHRLQSVRMEARATHLAYGFLRERSYQSMESVALQQPRWDKVDAMVKKYGNGELWERYVEWRNSASERIVQHQTWWGDDCQIAERAYVKLTHREVRNAFTEALAKGLVPELS